MILASDGLWDVMENQEAVDIVHDIVLRAVEAKSIDWRETAAFQEAAEYLTIDAYVRGSTDNIGVCVVAID